MSKDSRGMFILHSEAVRVFFGFRSFAWTLAIPTHLTAVARNIEWFMLALNNFQGDCYSGLKLGCGKVRCHFALLKMLSGDLSGSEMPLAHLK